VGGLASAGVIAGVVALTVGMDGLSAVLPAEAAPVVAAVAAPSAPAVTAPQASDQGQSAAWQAFAAAHAPLPLSDAPPEHWTQVVQWLPARSDVQPWVPVLLPREWQEGCHGQPIYPL